MASDAKRTLAFWRTVLGLRLVKQTVNFDDPGAYHLYFGNETGDPGTIVTFFEWPSSGRGRFGVGGVHHLALGVATRDGLLRWKRRLNDLGVGTGGPYERGYLQSLYFRDPDGQVVEIATSGPGYAHDEPADALGTSLIIPPDRQLRGAARDEAEAETWPEPIADVTADMAPTGLHHVTGMTDDLTQAGEFLDEALGLRLVKQSVNQDDPTTKHFFWASYDGQTVQPHSSYSLFGWTPQSPRAHPGAGQTHHVAFRVKDAEAQLAWLDHLRSRGISVSDVMDRTYFTSLYFRAPDGMLFELATDGPGFDIDESAATLGDDLRLPEWLEPNRSQIVQSLQPL